MQNYTYDNIANMIMDELYVRLTFYLRKKMELDLGSWKNYIEISKVARFSRKIL